MADPVLVLNTSDHPIHVAGVDINPGVGAWVDPTGGDVQSAILTGVLELWPNLSAAAEPGTFPGWPGGVELPGGTVPVGPAADLVAIEARARLAGDQDLRQRLDNLIAGTVDLSAVYTAIATETTAREATAVALGARIDTAASDAGELVTAETTARTAAIAALAATVASRSTALTAETETRAAADANLTYLQDTERAQRIAADQALADELAGLATELQAEFDAFVGGVDTSAVMSEADLRLAGDQALGTRIDNEAASRASGDNTLGARIDTEASARAAADTSLSGRIDAEVAARGTAVTGEAATRAAADTSLGGRIDTEAASRAAAVTAEATARAAAIAAEAAARDNAIAAEATARDTAISTAVSAIEGGAGGAVTTLTELQALLADSGDAVASLISQVTTLTGVVATKETPAGAQAKVDTEAAARSSADTALGGRVDAEAASRASAVSDLSTRIDAEVTNRGTAVTAEASTRAAADTSLGGRIDTETAARVSAISTEAAARAAGDSALDARVATLETNLPAEVTNRTNAVSAEATARAAADTAEQTARIAADTAEATARAAGDTAEASARSTAIAAAIAAEVISRNAADTTTLNAAEAYTNNLDGIRGNQIGQEIADRLAGDQAAEAYADVGDYTLGAGRHRPDRRLAAMLAQAGTSRVVHISINDSFGWLGTTDSKTKSAFALVEDILARRLNGHRRAGGFMPVYVRNSGYAYNSVNGTGVTQAWATCTGSVITLIGGQPAGSDSTHSAAVIHGFARASSAILDSTQYAEDTVAGVDGVEVFWTAQHASGGSATVVLTSSTGQTSTTVINGTDANVAGSPGYDSGRSIYIPNPAGTNRGTLTIRVTSTANNFILDGYYGCNGTTDTVGYVHHRGGQSGMTLDQLVNDATFSSILQHVRNQLPQLVDLALGTNDHAAGITSAQYSARLVAAIAAIRAQYAFACTCAGSTFTVPNGVKFKVGQFVTAGSSVDGLTAGATYVVASIPTATTFTLNDEAGNPAGSGSAAVTITATLPAIRYIFQPAGGTRSTTPNALWLTDFRAAAIAACAADGDVTFIDWSQVTGIYGTGAIGDPLGIAPLDTLRLHPGDTGQAMFAREIIAATIPPAATSLDVDAIIAATGAFAALDIYDPTNPTRYHLKTRTSHTILGNFADWGIYAAPAGVVDAEPLVKLAVNTNGQGLVGFGPGGGTTLDAAITRTAAGELTILGTLRGNAGGPLPVGTDLIVAGALTVQGAGISELYDSANPTYPHLKTFSRSDGFGAYAGYGTYLAPAGVADAQPVSRIGSNISGQGTVVFGAGGAAIPDIAVSRTAANELTVGAGSLKAAGNFNTGGATTYTTATYTPVAAGTIPVAKTVILLNNSAYVDLGAGQANIAAGTTGQVIRLIQSGAGITRINAGATPLVAIAGGIATSFFLQQSDVVDLVFDGTNWIPSGLPGSRLLGNERGQQAMSITDLAAHSVYTTPVVIPIGLVAPGSLLVIEGAGTSANNTNARTIKFDLLVGGATISFTTASMATNALGRYFKWRCELRWQTATTLTYVFDFGYTNVAGATETEVAHNDQAGFITVNDMTSATNTIDAKVTASAAGDTAWNNWLNTVVHVPAAA